MSEENFKSYVSKNLTLIDDLADRYGKYKISLSEGYWKELHSLVKSNTPPNYNFDGDDPLVKDGYRVVGWSRNIELIGTQTTVTIAFGVSVTARILAKAWPFLEKQCWTGIRVWLPSAAQKEFLKRAKQLQIKTEARDQVWVLWRFWEPLAMANIEQLHERISGNDREKGLQAIVDQMNWWKDRFEEIIAQDILLS